MDASAAGRLWEELGELLDRRRGRSLGSPPPTDSHEGCTRLGRRDRWMAGTAPHPLAGSSYPVVL